MDKFLECSQRWSLREIQNPVEIAYGIKLLEYSIIGG
jgi:hypothetical protein